MFKLGKKLFILALASLLAVSFSACGNNKEEPESQTESQTESQFEADVSSVPEDESETEEIDRLPDVEYPETQRVPNLTHIQDYFSEVPYVGLYNASSLEAYYTESPNEKVYPASLTKMVTAITALKYCSSDMICKVGTELNLVNEGSSVMWLGQGMKISVEQLIYGLMLPSGNDAAYTLAVNVARSIDGYENLTDKEAIEAFCQLMNDVCLEIGATDSHFVNPDGWDSEEQYTTVSDLAKIFSAGIKNSVIATAISTRQIKFKTESGHIFDLTNTNRLLNPESEFYCQDVLGGKTGTTDLAGASLVTVLSVGNEKYILVMAKCADNTVRFAYTLELISFAYRYHYANLEYDYAQGLLQ